jgi:hypothetical protein
MVIFLHHPTGNKRGLFITLLFIVNNSQEQKKYRLSKASGNERIAGPKPSFTLMRWAFSKDRTKTSHE